VQGVFCIICDMTYPTTVTWGDRLRLRVRREGGLSAAVRAIHSQLGTHLGSRTKFLELLNRPTPPSPTSVDGIRAWCLLSAIGEDPSAWGFPDEVLPPAFDPERVRTLLQRGCV
jgi:hypothetical protein